MSDTPRDDDKAAPDQQMTGRPEEQDPRLRYAHERHGLPRPIEVDAAEWDSRELAEAPPEEFNLGRNLFAAFRANNSGSLLGASVFEAGFDP